ncbi:hypothetical protein EJB05_27155, partial [Eragrostis curvula]
MAAKILESKLACYSGEGLQKQIRCNSDRDRVLHPLPTAASRAPASQSTCPCSARRWKSRRPCSVLGAPVDVAAARRPCSGLGAPVDVAAARRPCPADPARRHPCPSSSTSQLILVPSVATVPAPSSQASMAGNCSCSSFTLRQLQDVHALLEIGGTRNYPNGRTKISSNAIGEAGCVSSWEKCDVSNREAKGRTSTRLKKRKDFGRSVSTARR